MTFTIEFNDFIDMVIRGGVDPFVCLPFDPVSYEERLMFAFNEAFTVNATMTLLSEDDLTVELNFPNDDEAVHFKLKWL